MFELKFASFNAHSIKEAGKRAELEQSLLRESVAICLLQETFLKRCDNVKFDNYSIFRNDRPRARGGGTAIMIRNDLEAQVIPVAQLVTLGQLEVTAVVVKLEQGKKLFCLSVYNRSCFNSFSKELTDIFEKLCLDRPDNLYVVGGDFNANSQKWGSRTTHARGTEMERFWESSYVPFGMRLLTSVVPSRPQTAGFPDLLLVKDTIDLPGVLDGAVNGLPTCVPCQSDHLMLLITCRGLTSEPSEAREEECRADRLRKGVTKLDGEKFRAILHKRCPDFGLGIDNFLSLREKSLTLEEIDTLTERFTDLITHCMEAAMPDRKGNSVKSNYVPSRIRALSRQKTELVAALFRAYRRQRDDPLRVQVIAMLRPQIKDTQSQIQKEWRVEKWRRDMWRLDRLCAAMPRDFFKEMSHCYQTRRVGNAEAFVLTQSVLSNMLTRSTSPLQLDNGDRVITGKDVHQVLANSLEATFCSDDAPIELESSSQKVEFGPMLKADVVDDERFVSVVHLEDLIAGLKNKHSSGPDGIPNTVIKLLPGYFRAILLVIINNCINRNCLPRLWKISTVTFLKKDESKNGDIGNYRPISLLCCMSKLLERFFVNRLEKEVEEKELLSDNQYGFRRARSTTHAIGRLIDLVNDCRSQAQAAGAVYVDLRKAFDSVNHRLLFKRLETVGVTSDIVAFFRSFLVGRCFISAKGMSGVNKGSDLLSAPRHQIGGGVLQGSISGPILFSLFINKAITGLPVVAYADDLALVVGRVAIGDMRADLEVKYRILEQNLRDLKLTINQDKTKVMIFHETRGSYWPADIDALNSFAIRGLGNWSTGGFPTAGAALEVVKTFKYLGVTIDNFLKFRVHVEKIVGAASMAFRNVAKVVTLRGLEEKKRVWVYKTMIRPILTYACPVWVLLTPALMAKLTRCEYHMLRSIFGVYRRANGHYVSYRSRLDKAKIPGIDYQIVKLARRYLAKLEGSRLARVDQNRPRWGEEAVSIRGRIFSPETTMFIDAMGLLQDGEKRNVFYALDRHIEAAEFDLEKALNLSARRRSCREPTKFDIDTCKFTGKWSEWVVPDKYKLRGEANINIRH